MAFGIDRLVFAANFSSCLKTSSLMVTVLNPSAGIFVFLDTVLYGCK